ncbi:MAG: FAD-binding oxidoreductase [Acidimicrobiales bacterium]
MSGPQRRTLAGWANTSPTAALVVEPDDVEQLAQVLDRDLPRGAIARGLGRSYGDPAQNAGGLVVDTTRVSGLRDLDLATGRVTAEAGTSLDDLMTWLVPQGWFVPVTPGTRQVTVGGAVASDIHGKNHHSAGSWCDSVEALTIVTPAHGRQVITPEDDPDLFWATAGGMGLTGIVLDATFRLRPIETSLLAVDTDRTPDLDTTLALMESGDDGYPYSVAWIDLMDEARRWAGRSSAEAASPDSTSSTPSSAAPRSPSDPPRWPRHRSWCRPA